MAARIDDGIMTAEADGRVIATARCCQGGQVTPSPKRGTSLHHCWRSMHH